MLAKGQEIELVRLEKKRILIQYNIVIVFFSLSQVLEINVNSEIQQYSEMLNAEIARKSSFQLSMVILEYV
jgi:hypothetical protein